MTDVVREALEAAADFIQREADLRDASAFAETDPYIAEPRALCIKLAAALSALGEKDDGWLPIESAPKDGKLFLAATDDGRIMIWRGSILARDLAGPTPNHLSFPATHWRPLPAPPAAIRTGGDDFN